MDRLLTIDTGASAGWAYYLGDDLIACGVSKAPAKTAEARIAQHLANLAEWYAKADRVVVERGTWRGGGAGSMSPSQLADFNLMAGALGKEWVTPAEWKGKVPKEIHQPKILAALSPIERNIVTKVKCSKKAMLDVVDAVGIGLFVLGRLGRPPAPASQVAIRVLRPKSKNKTRTRPKLTPKTIRMPRVRK